MGHTITFPVELNEDKEITCVVCGLARTELAIVIDVPYTGRKTWAGLHTKCNKMQQVEIVKWGPGTCGECGRLPCSEACPRKTEPHKFIGDDADCSDCGEGRLHYLHKE